MYKTLDQFYNSEDWKLFRLSLIEKRTNKTDGVCYCEECHKAFKAGYEIIGHHIKYLTTANVNDASISLNPANVRLVCGSCHNEIHARFGYCTQRKVYIVWGAPCSGKTSYVKQSKGNSDMVVDIDSIWECVTGGDRYIKPAALKNVVFPIRNSLLDMVKTRAGKWERAWIVGGYPLRGEREKLAERLGAELIHIDTAKEICLQRLYSDRERQPVMNEWEKYIDDYFNMFQE